MTESDITFEDIKYKIDDVWGEYDDFENGGFEYVAYLILSDTKDMRDENWDMEESIEELADVCINAIRMMIHEGYNPEEEIIKRLDNHKNKNPEDIIKRYKQKFKKQGGYKLE